MLYLIQMELILTTLYIVYNNASHYIKLYHINDLLNENHNLQSN